MKSVHELTNLLPPERQAALRRDYFLRLASVALFALFALVLFHATMLVPSYGYLMEEVAVREIQLSSLDARLAASEEKEVDARLSTLEEDASYLLKLKDAPSASAALRTVLAVPRDRISLSGFTYAPPLGSLSGHMTIRGVATTRDALRAYHQALSALPGITNAELPIGAYAAEADIAFTVTLTGSFPSTLSL